MREIIRIERFQDFLRNYHGGRILDVACGAGQSIDVLTNSLSSWIHITGLDLSEEIMADAIQKFRGDKYSFVTGSATDLPFDSESFDLVCISKGLHHVPDPVKSLNEMLRVLKQDGYLLVIEMYSDGLNASQESQKMYHHLRVEVDKILGNDHYFTFPKKELIEIMEIVSLSGMQVVEYVEPIADPFDPQVIGEYITKAESWLDELKDYSENDTIREKIRGVEEKMKKDGFSKPPLLIFFGKKISE